TSSNLQSNTDSTITNQGLILFSWITGILQTIDIADNEVLMEICFTAVGNPGQRTDVTLGSYNGTIMDFSNLDNSINYTISDGSVIIVPSNSLDFTYSACGSGSYDLSIQTFGGRGPFEYTLSGESTASGT